LTIWHCILSAELTKNALLQIHKLLLLNLCADAERLTISSIIILSSSTKGKSIF